MSDEKLDYTPRPSRGRKAKPAAAPPAPRKRTGDEATADYAPRPARRESQPSRGTEYTPRPARKAKKGPASRRPKRIKLGSLVRSRTFLVIVGIIGLLVLVVVPVVAELLQARSADPAVTLVKEGDTYYDQGVQLLNQGDSQGAADAFERATGYYEQALAEDPQNVQVRTDMGTMYFYIGRLRGDTASVLQAIDVWNTVLQYQSDNLDALFDLGQGYAELGQVDQALAMWRRVIEVAPGSDIATSAGQMIQEYSVQPTPTPAP